MWLLLVEAEDIKNSFSVGKTFNNRFALEALIFKVSLLEKCARNEKGFEYQYFR